MKEKASKKLPLLLMLPAADIHKKKLDHEWKKIFSSKKVEPE